MSRLLRRLWGLAHPHVDRSLSSLAAAAGAANAGQAASPGPLAIVMFLPSALCGGLAYWQYERMAWKEELIELRGRMLEAPPRDIYSSEPSDYEKVSASGVFLHDKSVFVGPRPRSVPGQGIQSGYLLITPLYDPKRNGAIMVNRGWVPRSWEGDLGALQRSAPGPAGAGPVQVIGVIQPSEKPSAAIPDNVPDQLEFHWVDVPSLARCCGLPPDTPLVQIISDNPTTAQQMHRQSPMDANRERAVAAAAAAAASPSPSSSSSSPLFPIPKNSVDMVKFSTMPSDHMAYAATWAMLCLSLGLMARHAVFFPRRHRRIIHGNNKNLWAHVVTKSE